MTRMQRTVDMGGEGQLERGVDHDAAASATPQKPAGHTFTSTTHERDVAEAMGISPGTAAATLHTARRKLRELLTTENTTGEDDG